MDDTLELNGVEEISVEDKLYKVPVSVTIAKMRGNAEYTRLASKLGTRYAEKFDTRALAKYLKDHDIQVYPLADVREYLGRICKEKQEKSRYGTNFRWLWHPLRAVDKTDNFTYRNGSKAAQIYPHPVPVEVLMTVDKIVMDLGARPKFYVTKVQNFSDPFLGVTAGGQMFVIERWDEPTFRVGKRVGKKSVEKE